MMKKMPSWITASCQVSVLKTELKALPDSEVTPYIIIGDSGFDSSEESVVNTAYAVRDAQLTAQSALKDSTKWGKAAEKFESLARLDVIPVENTDAMTNGSQLNVVALLDEQAKVAHACRVAEMYHNQDNHTNKEALKKMAMLSKQSIPLNVVDHTSIVSQHAIVSCTESLLAASKAIEGMIASKPVEAATAFQRHVAEAELAYGIAHPSAITAELKESFENAKKKIAQNYNSTYGVILKNVSDSFVSADM